MSKKSNVHWEVVTVFNWGTTCKTTYATRALARGGMKMSRKTFTTSEGVTPYVTLKLFKVTYLPGLSTIAGAGVYIYEEAR